MYIIVVVLEKLFGNLIIVITLSIIKSLNCLIQKNTQNGCQKFKIDNIGLDKCILFNKHKQLNNRNRGRSI